MNGAVRASFESDLRPNPAVVIVALAAVGVAVGFLIDTLGWPPEATMVMILLGALALGLWLLQGPCPLVSRWLTALSPCVTIYTVSAWIREPDVLALAAASVALAAALVDLRGAALTAIGESVLLLSGWSLGVHADKVALATSLLAVWITLGIMMLIYSPVYRLAGWSWEQYLRARRLLVEAQSQQGELKEALRDLAQASRQLGVTNERLVAARLVAEEAQKAKAAFVANVSHEFRTPLNLIIGMIDLLTEAPDIYGSELPPVLTEDLDVVRRNCEHLASMINDVLDLTQAEAGRLALHRERVDFADVIRRALVVVRPLLAKKGLVLEVLLAPDLPEVYCDRTRIRQVIVNLLSNAARFTESGGVTVRIGQRDLNVRVAVSDTGPGIPPDQAAHIFEPFYQAEHVALGHDGSGLGLSISKQFIEMHGGQMWLESTVGVGSTFTFQLPISPPIGPSVGPERWLTEGWEWVERTGRADLPIEPAKPHLLVWDGTGELYPTCTRYTDEIEPVEVHDTEDLLSRLEESPAHAVLINAASPQDLTARMAQARRLVSDTPVIGCILPLRTKHIIAAGADGFLPKPVTRASLHRFLDSLARPVRRVLIADDDPATQQLFTRMLLTWNSQLQITTAATGREAIAGMRADRPDLVLLDIVLPEIDGWQVLALRSEEQALKDVTVVVVSAQDPREQPPTTPVFLAGMGQGLSTHKFLRCSQAVAAILQQPD